MTDSELRQRLKAYHLACKEIHAIWKKEGEFSPEPIFPPFPEECCNMMCGAKTRAGHPCKNKQIYPNGRCKFHGGLSTGPRTLEGKRRSALNIGKIYEDLIRPEDL